MSRLIVSNIETQNIKFDSDTTAFSINSSGQLNTSSIVVRGEGTATTNLQQGLLKNFMNMTSDGTASIRDSFNTSGLTDRGVGDFTIAFTNNFRAVEYSFNGNAGKGTSEGGSRNTGGITFDDYSSSGSGPQTSSCMFTLRRKDTNVDADAAYLMTQIAGDLA